MGKITTIGVDLAKNVFHVVGCDARGKRVCRKRLRRGQLLRYFANLPPSLVGMESCASASYWARELQALGHVVKLIPPQYVKPYVRGNKNDYNDALAIAEAVVRPQLRAVAIKTLEQQDIQALHRLRAQCVASRTALGNQLRGLLGEYGVVLPRGVANIRRRLPALLEDAENGLSVFFRGSSTRWRVFPKSGTVSVRQWPRVTSTATASWISRWGSATKVSAVRRLPAPSMSFSEAPSLA